MRGIGISSLFLGLFFFTSCIKPVEEGAVELSQPYFDVKGLVEAQLSLLTKEKATLKKTANIEGEEEKGKPEDLNWKKELKLFEQLDINKPVLLRSYSIDSLRGEGQLSISYKALDPDLKVREMNVVLNENGEAEEVKGMVQEENTVYLARRYMTLKLENGKIQSYKLEGFQKITTQDTMRYELKADVIW